MNSLGTKLISTAVLTSQLSTLKSAIQGTSQARHLYCFLLFIHHFFDVHKHNNLISRVKETCKSNDSYVFRSKKKLTSFQCNAFIDYLKFEFVKEYPKYGLVQLL